MTTTWRPTTGRSRGGILATVALAAGLLLGFTSPAAAHPQHTSCQGFGAFFADYARGGYVDFDLDNPGLAPFATEPGAIADTVAWEHDLFCD